MVIKLLILIKTNYTGCPRFCEHTNKPVSTAYLTPWNSSVRVILVIHPMLPVCKSAPF